MDKAQKPDENNTRGARPRRLTEGAAPRSIIGSGAGPTPNTSQTRPPAGGAGGSRPAKKDD